MDALDALVTRRSIRSYTSEPVPDGIVEQLLKAAMSAPSAGNEQPWHFVVITERVLLDKIPAIHPYSHMLKEAPAAILVCGDEHLESHRGFWVQDCSAATQNLLIAAHALGFGAVWLGVYPRHERVDGLRRLLGIPQYVIPFALISFGYPAERKQPAARYNPLRVHHNRWEK